MTKCKIWILHNVQASSCKWDESAAVLVTTVESEMNIKPYMEYNLLPHCTAYSSLLCYCSISHIIIEKMSASFEFLSYIVEHTSKHFYKNLYKLFGAKEIERNFATAVRTAEEPSLNKNVLLAVLLNHFKWRSIMFSSAYQWSSWI